MMKSVIIGIWMLGVVMGVGAQHSTQQSVEVAFPYPAIPDSIEEQGERLGYMLTHFWQHYCFADTTAQNRRVGEQGFVDFVNLMQYADSVTCAQAARVFADSIGGRLPHFETLMTDYLGDHLSPVHNDIVYAHLLRALTPTAQRLFLLHEVEKNQVGTAAADFVYTDEEGHARHLYDLRAELTLVVFHDPDCDQCRELMPRIKGSRLMSDPRIRVLFVVPDDRIERLYYLPALPALYLLDSDKCVVMKDATLEAIELER